MIVFERLIRELHETTRASRTTLRLDRPGEVFPVVAESLAEGIPSIAEERSMDLQRAPTYRFLAREQRILVQRDCLLDGPSPPPELIERYGVRAQMLAPVVSDGKLIGIVSVHYTGGPRDWTEDEIGALERAAARIREELSRHDVNLVRRGSGAPATANLDEDRR